MTASINKREMLVGGLSIGVAAHLPVRALAQFTPPPDGMSTHQKSTDLAGIPRVNGKTKKLFNSPLSHPNGLAIHKDGLWIAEEIMADHRAEILGLPKPPDRGGDIGLVDWDGKIITRVKTPSKVTSGLAYDGDYLWVLQNSPPYGVFQIDEHSTIVSDRQIPLGAPDNGGGSHGAAFHEGKLWIVSRRLHALMRVDPTTWIADVLHPIPYVEGFPRYHDMTFDNDGNIWLVVANITDSFSTLKGGLLKIDPVSGHLLKIVDLEPGSPDPHGLTFHDGKVICCDSGTRPGWNTQEDLSPRAREVFSIEFE